MALCLPTSPDLHHVRIQRQKSILCHVELVIEERQATKHGSSHVHTVRVLSVSIFLFFLHKVCGLVVLQTFRLIVLGDFNNHTKLSWWLLWQPWDHPWLNWIQKDWTYFSCTEQIYGDLVKWLNSLPIIVRSLPIKGNSYSPFLFNTNKSLRMVHLWKLRESIGLWNSQAQLLKPSFSI